MLHEEDVAKNLKFTKLALRVQAVCALQKLIKNLNELEYFFLLLALTMY